MRRPSFHQLRRKTLAVTYASTELVVDAQVVSAADGVVHAGAEGVAVHGQRRIGVEQIGDAAIDVPAGVGEVVAHAHVVHGARAGLGRSQEQRVGLVGVPVGLTGDARDEAGAPRSVPVVALVVHAGDGLPLRIAQRAQVLHLLVRRGL
ncbi:hypothetical protein CATMIT_01950, partial [Catenibacterium mitsuokai DSM 15897]